MNPTRKFTMSTSMSWDSQPCAQLSPNFAKGHSVLPAGESTGLAAGTGSGAEIMAGAGTMGEAGVCKGAGPCPVHVHHVNAFN